MKCPKCGHLMNVQEHPVERRPDHLNSAGRHKWLRYYHCRECGMVETLSAKERHETRKA